jgi:1-acyl-sn-glycerol-3-phosphate acyltransferase
MTVELTKVDNLTSLITDEFFKALSLRPDGRIRKFIAPIVHKPTWKFSNIAASFDDLIEEHSFPYASAWMMTHFVDEVKYHGRENIPRNGPLLLISNHPGLVDGLAISSNVDRDDIKLMMSGVPFVRHLKNTSQHMVFTTTDTVDRMTALRSSIRHLRNQGSLLIFATGKLDPDPSFRPVEAVSSALERWSNSVAVMVKSVPDIQVVVSIVSGVLSKRYYRHPLTRLRKSQHDRQRISEFMQVIRQLITSKKLNLKTKVSFSCPLTAGDFPTYLDKSGIMDRLIYEGKSLLNEHLSRDPAEWTTLPIHDFVGP